MANREMTKKNIRVEDIKNKTTKLFVMLVHALRKKETKNKQFLAKVLIYLVCTSIVLFPVNYVFAKDIKIPAGTPIGIYLEQEINSDDVNLGQNIDFIVQNPVYVNNEIVIKAGTRVNAQILKKKNNFIFGVPGTISVGNFQIIDNKSNVINLRGHIHNKGESKYWCHLSWIFCFGILTFFIKGNDAIIPAGTYNVIYTAGDNIANI